MRQVKYRWGFAIPTLSVAIFIVSLTQKDYCTETGCGDSIAAFISGIIGFAYGGSAAIWLANPILLASWVSFFRYRKFSLIMSLLASVVSISFLGFKEIINNEAGHMSKIVDYKIGYWLWVSSSLAMFIGTSILYYYEKKSPRSRKFGVAELAVRK